MYSNQELKYKNKNIIVNQTGGSTGKPVIFFQTNYQKDMGSAANLLWYKTIGYKIGKDRLLKIWGHPRDLSANQRVLYKIRNFLLRQKIFVKLRIFNS